jgi:diphthamide biosynthesis protein 2
MFSTSTPAGSAGAELGDSVRRAKSTPEDLALVYELDEVAADVEREGFQRVALQFPDHLLPDAGAVAEWLQRRVPDRKFFVVGDTSYGSCCVDVVAAAHYSADFLVHFGAACLAPVDSLPVRYVFGKMPLDVQLFRSAFASTFAKSDAVTVVCEQPYCHRIEEMRALWTEDFPHVHFAEARAPGLVFPSATGPASEPEPEPEPELDTSTTMRGAMWGVHPDVRQLVYVGDGESFVMCSMMLKNSNHCQFYSYNPNTVTSKQTGQQAGEGLLREETPTVNHALRGRYFCIEKAKEAEVYGIVVGTLSISGHLAMIDRLKSIIKAAGKKSYTFAVGKINVPKLANFADIDAFIVVACEVRIS